MSRPIVRRCCAAAALVAAGAVSDAAAQSWTELTPLAGPAPAARRNASAILDPVDNRVVIFGGFAATYTNDIWAFDLDTDTWENLTPAAGPPAPAPRLTPASVYDPVEHRMITWSGQGPGIFFNDAWAFDLDTNTWSQFSPAGGPPNIRYGVGYAWDPLAREIVTFAGFTNLGRFDDVWRFNGDAATWTDVSPATGPLARCLHAACYDPVNHRMIMYAGQNNSGPLDDIWALDLDTDTWTELLPTSKPAARYFTALVYDEANHRVTAFGGQTLLAPVNEVWVFDLWNDAWTQLSPGGTAPTPRWGSAGIYDGANDRMIVFGGFDNAVRNDVWSLDDLSGTSTGVRPAPASATLHPNHPNPFNPITTIRFEVAAREYATLRIYDARGRAVRTLFESVADAGVTTIAWNGRDDAGRGVASGVYFYRLETASGALSRKMVLLK